MLLLYKTKFYFVYDKKLKKYSLVLSFSENTVFCCYFCYISLFCSFGFRLANFIIRKPGI